MSDTTGHTIELAELVMLLRQLTAILLEHRDAHKIMVYTVPEVAQLLKCKESTVKNLIYRTKELQYIIVGRDIRVRHEDLADFLANRVTSCVYNQKVLP